MKIKLDSKLYEIDGNPIGERRECCVVNEAKEFLTDAQGNLSTVTLIDKTKTLTLRRALLVALMQDHEKEKEINKEKKYSLGVKIAMAKAEAEIDNTDLKFLSDLIKIRYSTLIWGQVNDLLNGKIVEFAK